MKKSMKKFIVACAAVSAITVAAGMSAMAATYTADNNSVKFDVPAGDADTQKTVLVIPEDKKGNVAEEDILYINQDAALADTALLKGTEKLPDGNYVVMVGYYKDGAFAIAEDPFTIGEVVPGKEIVIGDIDINGRISSSDAAMVLQHAGKGITLEGDALLAAEACDGNTRVSSADAAEILKYVGKQQVEFVGTKKAVQ